MKYSRNVLCPGNCRRVASYPANLTSIPTIAQLPHVATCLSFCNPSQLYNEWSRYVYMIKWLLVSTWKIETHAIFLYPLQRVECSQYQDLSYTMHINSTCTSCLQSWNSKRSDSSHLNNFHSLLTVLLILSYNFSSNCTELTKNCWSYYQIRYVGKVEFILLEIYPQMSH